MATCEDDSKIVKIKSMIPTSKSKNNLLMTYFDSPTTGLINSTSQYNILHSPEDVYNENYWLKMFPNAVYFHVYNSVLGDVFAMIYSNNHSNHKNIDADTTVTTTNSVSSNSRSNLSSFIISKHGCSIHSTINLSSKSKYFPAIENLSPQYRHSRVRKALAVSLLKSVADLNNLTIDALYKQANLTNSSFDWDQTQAGLLASEMELINTRTPLQIGSYIYNLGYLTPNLLTASYVVDVIYNDDSNDGELSEKNNALAFLLGKQLEQLFDPLTEYSPEPTEKVYKIPHDNSTNFFKEDNNLIKSICSELITIQTNYTVSLVHFLQNYVVPLRVKVLENKLLPINSAKLNSIFPPTIDEVTRINCIFLDMLKLAEPYGSYEILKACGTTIPYFYKAQMRHEAAIKNFHSNYLQFLQELENADKNSIYLNYDQRTVETCVYSSLHLVKIQLIIQRLVKNKDWPKNLLSNVEKFSDSCNNTISSFANDKLSPYNGRIFTPTGKILTEIAKGWPSELQYGWLTRRVVAVFDATDILIDNVKNRSVIIIFSDHVLFLSIDDDEHYNDIWSNEYSKIHKPSVSDTLIHSLTNETPLNKLPSMSVKFWVNINDLHALYFTNTINNNENNKNPESFVRFFNDKDPLFTGIYELDKVSGKYVTEVIARAKVLNKSQSFHLFVGNDNDIIDGNKKVYYTAHEKSSYIKEDTKSPFIILFNQDYDVNLLYQYNVYAFLTLNFIDQNTVRIEGLSRCSFDDNSSENSKLLYDVNVKVLNASLLLILNELFSTHISIYNPMMVNYLLLNNGFVNSQAIKIIETPLDVIQKNKLSIINKVQKLKKERKIVSDISQSKVNRKKSLELFAAKTFSKNSDIKTKDKSTKLKSETGNKQKVIKATQIQKAKSKKGVFSKLFSKSEAKENKRLKPIIKKQSVSSPAINEGGEDKPSRVSSVIRHISKKREIDYNELKPAKPKKSLSKSIISRTKKNINLSNNESEGNLTTASTSIYVNSHFEFPMENISQQKQGDLFTSDVHLSHDNDKVAESPMYTSITPDTSVDTPESSAPYKYAPLKTEVGHSKGYKDSVDLMGKLELNFEDNDIVSKDKNIDYNDLNKNYDEDLFELINKTGSTSNEKNISFKETSLEDQKNIVNDVIDLSNDDSVLSSTDKANKIKSTTTNAESATQYFNNIKNIQPVSLVAEETVDKDTEKIRRSESFYNRFIDMRCKQDEILRKVGMSPIVEMPEQECTVLTSDQAFKSCYSRLYNYDNSNLDLDEEFEEQNWIAENSEYDHSTSSDTKRFVAFEQLDKFTTPYILKNSDYSEVSRQENDPGNKEMGIPGDTSFHNTTTYSIELPSYIEKSGLWSNGTLIADKDHDYKEGNYYHENSCRNASDINNNDNGIIEPENELNNDIQSYDTVLMKTASSLEEDQDRDLLGDIDLTNLTDSFKSLVIHSESTREFAKLLNEKSYAYLNEILEGDDFDIDGNVTTSDPDYDYEYSKKLANSSAAYLSNYLS